MAQRNDSNVLMKHKCDKCDQEATTFVRDARLVGTAVSDGEHYGQYEPGELRKLCDVHKCKPVTQN